MSRYIDIEYIRNRVTEDDLEAFTRDKNEGEGVNLSRVNAIIADACALFDQHAAQAGYSVPIAAPDDFVKLVVFDLFLYRLSARKYDDEEMKDTYARHTKANEKLAKIASGEIKLQCATIPASGAGSTGGVIYVNQPSSERIFNFTNSMGRP